MVASLKSLCAKVVQETKSVAEQQLKLPAHLVAYVANRKEIEGREMAGLIRDADLLRSLVDSKVQKWQKQLVQWKGLVERLKKGEGEAKELLGNMLNEIGSLERKVDGAERKYGALRDELRRASQSANMTKTAKSWKADDNARKEADKLIQKIRSVLPVLDTLMRTLKAVRHQLRACRTLG